jgi:hypothetical protein
MLDIILMICIIFWFTRMAEKKGKSKPFWGFIGGISYYEPVLFLDFYFFRR